MAGKLPRILVLGATGMLGHEAVRVLANNFDVHASVRDPAAAKRVQAAGTPTHF